MPGAVIEEAPVDELFANPRHPYTQGLIRSIPHIDRAATSEEAPRGHSRRGAEPDHASARLPLRAALQIRDAGLPRQAMPDACAISAAGTRSPAFSKRGRLPQ